MIELGLLAVAEFLGITPPKLLEMWREHNAKTDATLQQRQIEKRAEARPRVFENGLEAALLEAYYPDPEVAAAGFQRYSFHVANVPVVLNLITRQGWTGLRAPLPQKSQACTLSESASPVPTVNKEEAQKILFDVIRDGRKAWNDPLFRLMQIEVRPECFESVLALTDYYTYLTTLGMLEDELVQALLDNDYDPTKALRNRTKALPCRERFLPNAGVFSDLNRWLCAGGINVLFAICRPPPDDDFLFMAQRRSTKVATGRGLITLVPQGVHQPKRKANARLELGLENSVFREVYEECFGGKEVEKKDMHRDPQWFFHECPGIQWFRENHSCPNSVLSGGGRTLLRFAL